MEDQKLPVKSIQHDTSSEALHAIDPNMPLSNYTLPQKTYPIENLEVHGAGNGSQVFTDAPSNLVHTPYSGRKAIIVSLVVTVLVVVATGIVAAFFLKRTNNVTPTSDSSTATQDISFGNTQSNVPHELSGSDEALLVNGDIITR